MSDKLSVTIITKNEEENIERCLRSVDWADEIVVVDSGSQDNTVQICRQFGCLIVESEWLGFGKTKQLAVDTASNDWILSIDADEELSQPLQKEISELTNQGFDDNAYRIRRSSFYLSKMIRYCGWQSDAPLRIFNRNQGGFNDKSVHESVITAQKIVSLKNRMLHYTYPTLESHFRKMKFYGDIAAENLYKKSKNCSSTGAIVRGLAKFIKMYTLQFGFLDGIIGYKLCKNSAWGVWYKYNQLHKLNSTTEPKDK